MYFVYDMYVFDYVSSCVASIFDNMLTNFARNFIPGSYFVLCVGVNCISNKKGVRGKSTPASCYSLFQPG